jgi:hypothetical protein
MRETSHRLYVASLVLPKVTLALVIAGLMGACSDECESPAPTIEVSFRFGMRGDVGGAEDFIAVTSNADIIAQARGQLALPESERTLHINGPIERGNGGHNFDWSWHFVPGTWILTGASAEVCNGGPQGVEDDLDYWIDTVQSLCPWSSYVKEEISDPQQD